MNKKSSNMNIIRTSDKAAFAVRKYVLGGDGDESVWCDEWYGRHVIGQDCEWADRKKIIDQMSEIIIKTNELLKEVKGRGKTGKFNHNKHGLKVGDSAIVDKDHHNSCEVEIIKFTPSQMYSTVRILGEEGEGEITVMTNRLSPIERGFKEFITVQKNKMFIKRVDITKEEAQDGVDRKFDLYEDESKEPVGQMTIVHKGTDVKTFITHGDKVKYEFPSADIGFYFFREED